MNNLSYLWSVFKYYELHILFLNIYYNNILIVESYLAVKSINLHFCNKGRLFFSCTWLPKPGNASITGFDIFSQLPSQEIINEMRKTNRLPTQCSRCFAHKFDLVRVCCVFDPMPHFLTRELLVVSRHVNWSKYNPNFIIKNTPLFHTYYNKKYHQPLLVYKN